MGAKARMAGLEVTISQQTADICGEALGPALSAIVLTGSMARGEATAIEQGEGTRLMGDAEFFLVFKKQTPLPSDAALVPLASKVEDQLSNRGLRCHVELTPVRLQYFRDLRPSIFGYELRACGRVVWGDPSVLSLIAPFSAADIPREDAWRLLVNRMIECLEVAPQLLEAESRPTQDFAYRLTKLCLDMATSYLVFAGEFRPTYRARAQVLQQLATRDETAKQCPLQLRGFSQQVARCTEFKLGSAQEPSLLWGEGSVRIFEEASQLWRWELVEMTGAPPGLTDSELMELWMQHQTFSDRTRGWLTVLRECGWHRSWRNWPRWLRLARWASPRALVYALASELFLSIPEVLPVSFAGRITTGELRPSVLSFAPLLQEVYKVPKTSSWVKGTSALPIPFRPSAPANSPDWAKLALSIAANYHRFLEHIRF